MTQVTVTLNKANRIAQEIASRIKKDSSYPGFSLTTTLKVPIYAQNMQTFEALVAEKNRVQEETREAFTEAMAWIDAKAAVKKAIFRKNVSCGLSNLIEDMEKEKNKLKILEKVRDASKRVSGNLTTNDIKLSLVEGLVANQEEYSGPSISVTVVDLLDKPENIEREMVMTQYAISQLQDKMFQLNNMEKVEFFLDVRVAEKLGLKKLE